MQTEYGLYFRTRPFDVVFGDGQTPIEDSYRRIPLSLTLLVAPLMGAAFVMLFPIIVLGVPAVLLGNYLKERSYLARSSYEPCAAYFNKPETTPGSDPRLKDLEEEVANARTAEGSSVPSKTRECDRS